mgnify:FL=1
MVTIQLNTFLIGITKAISMMPLNRYIQEASRSGTGRFYVNRGAAGGLSISEKNVRILASGVAFYPDNHFNNNNDEKIND